MKNYTIAYAVAALTVVPLAAQAGGYTPAVVEAAPIVAPPALPSWEGAYVGATLGYSFGSVGNDDKIRVATPARGNSAPFGEYKLSGVNGGIHIGYAWQRGAWVFGPELGVEGGNVEDSFNYNGNYSGKSKLKYAAELRFRTGYLVNPDTLIYGVAGVSQAKFDYTVRGNGFWGPVDIDDTVSRTGYVVGFGVEHRLTPKVSLVGEFNYADYGKKTLRDSVGNSTAATPNYGTVKLGVNYRF